MTKDEYLEEKAAKRRALMSEKEIKEADKFIRWYREAHTDKSNRGLIKKWEEVEAYWEGDIDDAPTDDTEPCSNTNIVNSNIEGRVAYLVDQNIALQIDPREPGDRPFCNRVKILADFIQEKNKMYRKIDVHERRRKKMGTGIFRVLWSGNELDGSGLPTIEPINPAYLYVDPSITDIYKVQKARYIIEVESRSIYDARMQYGDKVADAIVGDLDPVENSFIYDEDHYGYGADDDSQKYLHMYIWTRYKDKDEVKLRLVQMSGCGVILSDTKKEAKNLSDDVCLYPNEKYPYFFTPDMYREGCIWGKSSAELLLPISDQIDDLDNQILANARLVGNPVRLVANSSGIDADKITNEPGQIIPTNDINGTKWDTPPTMPQYIIDKRRELINNDRPIVTRFSDQQIGFRQQGVDTATEALTLQNSGNTAVEHDKGLLQETLSDVFEYAIELAILNYNETMIFRITGDNGEDSFDSFNPSELNAVPLLIESDTEFRNEYVDKWKEKNPGKDISELNPEDYEYKQVEGETRKIKYDIRVTVGAGMPNNKAFKYNVMIESYQKKLITKKETRKFLIDSLGIPVPEIPESLQEQQEIGIYDTENIPANPMAEVAAAEGNINNYVKQEPGVQGLTDKGNVSLNQVKGALQ